jgi:hypothetical protein
MLDIAYGGKGKNKKTIVYNKKEKEREIEEKSRLLAYMI